MEKGVEGFKNKFPETAFETQVRKGAHPYIKADYVCGNSHTIDLRNRSDLEVHERLVIAAHRAGYKNKKFKQTVVNSTPSVQGQWSPYSNGNNGFFEKMGKKI